MILFADLERCLSRKLFVCLLGVAAGCIFLTSCVSVQKISVEGARKEYPSYLDTQFSEVEIRNAPIGQVLVALSEVVRKSPDIPLPFVWSIDSGFTDSSGSDPRVSFSARNVSLRTVLDALSKQAGWKYEDWMGVRAIFHPNDS